MMKKCPYCAEDIQDEAIICRYCGRELKPTTLPVKEPTKTSNLRLILILLIVVACAVLYMIGSNRPQGETTSACKIIASSYLNKLQTIVEHWDDTAEVAAATSRIALSGPVSELQSIKRELEALDPPDCAYRAHNHMLNYMNNVIQAYTDFMAQKSDTVVQSDFANANRSLELFTEEMKKINQ